MSTLTSLRTQQTIYISLKGYMNLPSGGGAAPTPQAAFQVGAVAAVAAPPDAAAGPSRRFLCYNMMGTVGTSVVGFYVIIHTSSSFPSFSSSYFSSSYSPPSSSSSSSSCFSSCLSFHHASCSSSDMCVLT